MLFNKAKSALEVSFSPPPSKKIHRTLENQLIIAKEFKVLRITGTLNSYNSYKPL